ncbi:MAG: methyltransferase domain-containing protein [Candidatus Baltobacteraceae bacterium]
MSLFVALAHGIAENGDMRAYRPNAAEAAFTQPLTEELLECSGVSPGMRVLVLGRGVADVALLVAERVGRRGAVIALHEDPRVVAEARRRAADECFDRVSFLVRSLEQFELEQPVDAVVGRFFLMHQRDPVEAIRRAAALVHEGGRILFHEWHYDSVLWAETSDWPHLPLYRRFARWSVEGLRRRNAHADMGLRLVNACTDAGLPMPAVRTDLRTVGGSGSLGYSFFEDAVRELAARDVDIERFAERLERETTGAGGHVFLPLQVGVWTRVPERSRV